MDSQKKAEFWKAHRCTLQWIIPSELCVQIRSIKVEDAQSHPGLRVKCCGNRTKTNSNWKCVRISQVENKTVCGGKRVSEKSTSQISLLFFFFLSRHLKRNHAYFVCLLVHLCSPWTTTKNTEEKCTSLFSWTQKSQPKAGPKWWPQFY